MFIIYIFLVYMYVCVYANLFKSKKRKLYINKHQFPLMLRFIT